MERGRATIYIVLGLFIIILSALFGYFIGRGAKEGPPRQPIQQTQQTQEETKKETTEERVRVNTFSQPLTKEEAEKLVFDAWGGCTPARCTKVTVVPVNLSNGNATVIAIYEGLQDDSVARERREATATLVNGAWVLGEPELTWQCWPGRGHQNFSDEPCL